ncbi:MULTISPECIES: type I-E CRISPR-associated protein Cse2/CasB [unclassified Streptomyces]|uniref:type I-E CRISPR-associated protein Cse2/CasB n=1 Tax=unclassified Streptomyces TaxID=2593676 RepID=UPI000DAE56EA|nr:MULTISPECIES: type I-E CRISPR-associated protein Cse2/CasB [unclassified Streptomyces]PZT77283.1 type I-E CRISPR-associated protein Cse2/CasB [Streptomyces sp. AC1-42W]PZT78765.1 type I-E CRISPR-associated protein Cse2/CasB [Streptomyces sp. AC1-42T]
MTSTRTRPYFWEEAAEEWDAKQRAGQPSEFSEYVVRKLRAVREGVGREAGSVASMRSVHRVFLRDEDLDSLPHAYVAEHYALTLFGLHQHASSEPVHRPGIGLGTAFLRLWRTEPQARPARERRLLAAATAQDVHELAQHLQRLVPLLRQAGIGLDYTRLFFELQQWDGPKRDRTLRAWGLQCTDPGTSAPPGDEGGQRSDADSASAPYWVTYDPKSRDAAADLAALRSGIGREAGTVPAMWTFHRIDMEPEWRDRGALTRDLKAEHAALTLFARHQQAQEHRMHIKGHSPGTAVGSLAKKTAEGKGTGATTALERRFGVLLTSNDFDELVMHLRSLVPLLNQAGIGLDYDLIRKALRAWDDPRRPDAAASYRQRWERDFHTANMP